mmetsp:Transcript_5474/g.9743  ORF Transcript_5474/g.9743 Transcript_5474/m.9743 type:complete len:86 (-) Transcript_5474:861-1118(-)
MTRLASCTETNKFTEIFLTFTFFILNANVFLLALCAPSTATFAIYICFFIRGLALHPPGLGAVGYAKINCEHEDVLAFGMLVCPP